MTHIVAGFPNFEFGEKVFEIFQKNKIEFAEIQFPFSDPVADGPILMRANEVSLLENKTTIAQCFDFVAKVAPRFSGKIFLMGYFNTVFRFGVEKFCKAAARAGASGLIFPDAPFDEAENENFLAAARENNLDFVCTVAENVSNQRLRKIAEIPAEIIYCISRFGTTGSGDFSANLTKFLERIRANVDKKIAVGFGIRQKSDLAQIPQSAQIAVVGSAIAEIVFEKVSDDEKLSKIDALLQNLRG